MKKYKKRLIFFKNGHRHMKIGQILENSILFYNFKTNLNNFYFWQPCGGEQIFGDFSDFWAILTSRKVKNIPFGPEFFFADFC